MPLTNPSPTCKRLGAATLGGLRTSLSAALVTIGVVACGGNGGNSSAPPPTSSGALAASQPGELTGFVQARLRTLSAEGRLGSAGMLGVPTAMAGLGSAPTAMGATTAPRSGTLVHEEGVQEADLLQTDGQFLYTLQPQPGAGLRVAAYEGASDGRALPLSNLKLPAEGATDLQAGGLLLSTDHRTLAVLSQQWSPAPVDDVCPDCPRTLVAWMRSSVEVQRVDVANPAAPAAGERLSIDGFLVDSRLVGDALVLVSTHRPAIAALNLPATATAAEREAAIAGLSASSLLPRVRRNGGAPEPLMADTDCYLQPGNASLAVEFTTITVFDLKSPTLARTSRCFVGGTEALYMSTRHLYLATTRWSYPADGLRPLFPADIKTDIHKFALGSGGSAADGVTYRGTGQVEGHLGWDPQRKSYRLSEHAGDLRVLSYTGSQGWGEVPDNSVAPSPARLTVLRERTTDRTLQVVATLPNAARPASIGKPGEQVYAVRFVGDRGYVVTFRRTDPLYVLDLSDPADPRTVGALEVAGFSEHLVPLPNQLLLGVGRDADTSGRVLGLKVALFDMANPAQPAERHSLSLGAEGSSSTLDRSRHGLNLMLVNGVARVALPVSLSSTPYAGWQHGLQQLEVDTTARTLLNRGLAGARQSPDDVALDLERSAQVGDTLYHLSEGVLRALPW